jgi:hypothetical protein
VIRYSFETVSELEESWTVLTGRLARNLSYF